MSEIDGFICTSNEAIDTQNIDDNTILLDT